MWHAVVSPVKIQGIKQQGLFGPCQWHDPSNLSTSQHGLTYRSGAGSVHSFTSPLHLGLFLVSSVSTLCQCTKFLIPVSYSQVEPPFIYIWLRYSCKGQLKMQHIYLKNLACIIFKIDTDLVCHYECGSRKTNKTNLSIVYYLLRLFTQRAE